MRSRFSITRTILLIIFVANVWGEEPVNLAPKAEVSASSEYSGDHLARWDVVKREGAW